MGSAEIGLEIFTSSLQHQVYGNSRSIAGDQGAWSAILFNLIKYLFLDVQIFYYYLNYPITIRHFGHVVVKVSQGYQVGVVLMVQWGRLGFNSGGERISYNAIAYLGCSRVNPFSCSWSVNSRGTMSNNST